MTVELVETRTSRIVWADVFDHKLDEAFIALDEIGNRIVSSIASEIEIGRAKPRDPETTELAECLGSLSPRPLAHVSIHPADNALAQNFFQMALRLDPTFSRAYAGLSFTHWQNAFQRWADRDLERDWPLQRRGKASSWTIATPPRIGRWGGPLAARPPGRVAAELERAVDLSPNFALGHYSLSFVHSQSGDPQVAIASADHSLRLSPFDPLLFGMLGR